MPEAVWNFRVFPHFRDVEAELQRQQQARIEQMRRAQEEIEARQTRYEEACKILEARFLALLSEENRQRWETDHFIIITGSRGGKYRLALGWSGNVHSLRASGRTYLSYCIHLRTHEGNGAMVPLWANMIAQMLMIVTDEDRFLKTAYLV